MPKSALDASPVRRQYLDIKRRYPNEILFFRLGDFYETFDEDAEKAAKALDIVLTERTVGKGVKVPMAGIPFHAAENYIARLIEKGYHVAICEQIGDQPAKGIFPRKVVRVVTPGTLMEPGLLPGDENNYLAAVVLDGRRAGIAYVDITTGEFSATELDGDKVGSLVRAELQRLRPAEILLPEETELAVPENGHRTTWPGWRFETGRCEDALKAHFKTGTLDGFGLRGRSLAVRAAGGIVQYLEATQESALGLLSGLNTYSVDGFMTLDASTRRNLELTETIRGGEVRGSLLGIIDATVTPMGKRLLRGWVSKPLLDVGAIAERQDAVQAFFEDGLLRAEMRAAIKPLGDMERLTNRILGGMAGPRDLTGLRNSLARIPMARALLPPGDAPDFPFLAGYSDCAETLDLLEKSITDEPPATLQQTGVIRPGFSPELDEVLSASSHARDWIANLESQEQKRTGIRSLKVGFNKVFGYYIEVTRANAGMVPDDYIRKQTLVNAERYITPEMKDYESKVLNADERAREIERRVFAEICLRVSDFSGQLLGTARVIARLDVLAALAETAAVYGYVRPEVVEEDILEIVDGRHPVVEHFLPGGERYVPNDVKFEAGERIRIITGPNMAGKSTALRQVALIVLLAQMGSCVPAKAAKIGLVDRIFTRIGAQDEIHAGQSTFMVEMVEAANILHHATNRSLLVLDEIGRGTSTYDGLSIAWAVVEYIHNHPELRAKTLFATHYHELTQLSDLLPGVRNYNVAVSEADGQVVFLHKIIPGGADRSYGIHVAQLAGLPKPVIQRANEILLQLETSSGSATKIDPHKQRQIALFPETNPLLGELGELDVNEISPIEALNKLYEWQRRFTKGKEK